ncbi:SAM dependent methyltransferase [alpha proteobacterium U9-1i]|nr:SAM dependent methyltransferase [alpha proteobacterium U9-1i]
MTAPVPKILVADDWREYRVIDSGNGRKLEQVGPYRFDRPEPQALWRPRRENEWAKADAVFAASGDEESEAGRWRFDRELPPTWPIAWDGMTFLSRPTPFRHLAFFPEHSVHWRYAADAISGVKREQSAEVLNLFGYTGLASLAAARAGAKVTHVDASKKAIGFARENQAAAGLDNTPIRWICDDAHGFVKRELRRGKRYHGIILDPPKYGRGPNGETWKLEDTLSELIRDCAALLGDARPGQFMILTVYAVRLSFIALAQAAQDATSFRGGAWEFGEMALPHADDERVLPTAIYARWRT